MGHPVNIIAQVGLCTRPAGGRCDRARSSPIITDHRLSRNEAFSLVKCIRWLCRIGRRSFWSWFDLIYVKLWRKSAHFSPRYARKTIITFSFPVTLTFLLSWPLDLDFKFASSVTVVQGYISTKLQVSKLFLFLENRSREAWDGQTERQTDRYVQHLLRPLGRDGRNHRPIMHISSKSNTGKCFVLW